MFTYFSSLKSAIRAKQTVNTQAHECSIVLDYYCVNLNNPQTIHNITARTALYNKHALYFLSMHFVMKHFANSWKCHDVRNQLGLTRVTVVVEVLYSLRPPQHCK